VKFELAYDTWDAQEAAAAERVIRSGKYTMGDEVRRFESSFATCFSRKHAVMVNSGSSANLVAVGSLFFKRDRPLRPGDEVIVPAISWATTFYPLMQYGLRLRFLDVELDTLNMDVSLLKKALTPRTRMVVAVSILGNPCALDVMRAFCDEHDLYLFEDNCESMGATLGGKPCGAFGDVSTFSTFFSHHISTGEGGIVTTDDEELRQLAVCLRAHGWTRDLPSPSLLYRKGDEFADAYRFLLPGYNVRPMEISGAVGSVQLGKLDAMLAGRRRNAEKFHDLFKDDDRFIFQRENGASSWFSFTFVMHPEWGVDRGDVLAALAGAGIGARMVTGGNFLRHDVIRHCDHDVVAGSRNADLVHDRGFFVGNAPRDLSAELEHLHGVLGKLKGGRRGSHHPGRRTRNAA